MFRHAILALTLVIFGFTGGAAAGGGTWVLPR
jgi:hypothetical protein